MTLLNYAQARDWCHKAHADIGQTYGDQPYGTRHLDAVAATAVAFGFGNDEDVMLACQAHDVLEDTANTVADMRNAGFPERVCSIVERLSDPAGMSRAEAKKLSLPRIAADRKAIIVKCCDRLANGISSRANHPTKFARYCAEYPDFRKYLRSEDDVEMAPFWACLDSLFGFVSC